MARPRAGMEKLAGIAAVLIALGELDCSGRESCCKIMFLADNPEHFDQLDSSS